MVKIKLLCVCIVVYFSVQCTVSCYKQSSAMLASSLQINMKSKAQKQCIIQRSNPKLYAYVQAQGLTYTSKDCWPRLLVLF